MNTVFPRPLRPSRSIVPALCAAAALCCSQPALAGTVYPSGTPLASQAINTYFGGIDTVTLNAPVSLTQGQMYWVAVVPTDANSWSLWLQNPNLGQYVGFTGDGQNFGDSGYGAGAYPGEFSILNGNGSLIYSDMASNPLGTGHAWVVSGANYGYNGYASYFFSPVTDEAATIQVPLVLADENYAATVELFAGAPPDTVYPETLSSWTLDGQPGYINSTVSGVQDPSGQAQGPYLYNYTITYQGSDDILAIPLLSTLDVSQINLPAGATLGNLTQLPGGETVAQFFGSQYVDALVIDLAAAPSGATVYLSFQSPFAPVSATWAAENGDNTNDNAPDDPPIPGPSLTVPQAVATPEPGTLSLLVVGAGLALGVSRRRRLRA